MKKDEPEKQDRPDASPPKAVEAEQRRDRALAKYDAHPGIAVALLAVMALLFVVIVYEFVTADRFASGPHVNNIDGRDGRNP